MGGRGARSVSDRPVSPVCGPSPVLPPRIDRRAYVRPIELTLSPDRVGGRLTVFTYDGPPTLGHHEIGDVRPKSGPAPSARRDPRRGMWFRSPIRDAISGFLGCSGRFRAASGSSELLPGCCHSSRVIHPAASGQSGRDQATRRGDIVRLPSHGHCDSSGRGHHDHLRGPDSVGRKVRRRQRS